jgi:hypothetical protein
MSGVERYELIAPLAPMAIEMAAALVLFGISAMASMSLSMSMSLSLSCRCRCHVALAAAVRVAVVAKFCGAGRRLRRRHIGAHVPREFASTAHPFLRAQARPQCAQPVENLGRDCAMILRRPIEQPLAVRREVLEPHAAAHPLAARERIGFEVPADQVIMGARSAAQDDRRASIGGEQGLKAAALQDPVLRRRHRALPRVIEP